MTDEEIVFCKDCKYCKCDPYDCNPCCTKNVDGFNYVSGEPTYMYCHDCNTDGKCSGYEKEVPETKETKDFNIWNSFLFILKILLIGFLAYILIIELQKF